MDPDSDAAGHGTVGRHADELVLQFGEPGAAQRLCALPATNTWSRTPKRRVCELVPSVAGSASGKPSDAPTAARHGRGSRELASRSLPAATATDTADVEQLELLERGWVCRDGWEKRRGCWGCCSNLNERHLSEQSDVVRVQGGCCRWCTC